MAVLRDEGTNGDEEMRAAFKFAGFKVVDLHMTDLLSGKTDLKSFRGIAAAGGFSYGDVPESAKGEAATIRYNDKLREMFDEFYRRPDTFSLGVCNGAQLLTMMGWVPYYGLADEKQPLFTKNLSGIFESRWSLVEIQPSPSILFKDMVGSRLGVWVAHGEGRFNCPDLEILNKIQEHNLAPLVFVDEYSQATTKYPDNPNGSPFGITALCSHDGRHTAMMPHPERCFLKWQWPYLPQELSDSWQSSPWLKMFQNAYDWCLQH
jgi:phosphoribosylformylglycinamidine synthase